MSKVVQRKIGGHILRHVGMSWIGRTEDPPRSVLFQKGNSFWLAYLHNSYAPYYLGGFKTLTEAVKETLGDRS